MQTQTKVILRKKWNLARIPLLIWYYIQVGSISLTFLQSREIEGSPVRWTSEIQCAKDMISMKSLTFSSHTSGAKVRHQGPPGTAEAQPLIIIIIIVSKSQFTEQFSVHHDSRTPKLLMVNHGVTKISLPPSSLMGQWIEKLETKKTLNHNNCAHSRCIEYCMW